MPQKAGAWNTLAILAHESGHSIAEMVELEGQKTERGSSTMPSWHPEMPDHHMARPGDTPGCGLAHLEARGGPKAVIGKRSSNSSFCCLSLTRAPPRPVDHLPLPKASCLVTALLAVGAKAGLCAGRELCADEDGKPDAIVKTCPYTL